MNMEDDFQELQRTLQCNALTITTLQSQLKSEQLKTTLLEQTCTSLRKDVAALQSAIHCSHDLGKTQEEAVQAHAACLKHLLEAEQRQTHTDATFREFRDHNQEHVSRLNEELTVCKAEIDVLKAQLDETRDEHQKKVKDIVKQHKEATAALQRQFADRLSSLEGFKNNALAAKRAAEEQLAHERNTWNETITRLQNESRQRSTEDTLKSRLISMRAELDAVKRERDQLRQNTSLTGQQANINKNTTGSAAGGNTLGVGAGNAAAARILRQGPAAAGAHAAGTAMTTAGTTYGVPARPVGATGGTRPGLGGVTTTTTTTPTGNTARLGMATRGTKRPHGT